MKCTESEKAIAQMKAMIGSNLRYNINKYTPNPIVNSSKTRQFITLFVRFWI